MIEIICVAERLTLEELSGARESRLLAADSASTDWSALPEGGEVDCAESFAPHRQIAHSVADRTVSDNALRALVIARHLKDGVPIADPR